MTRLIGLMIVFACICVLLSCGGSKSQGAANDRAKNDDRIQKSIDVLNAISAEIDKSIPKEILDSCHAVAVVPGVVKTSFLIGGHYGTGVVTAKDQSGKWSNPSFIDLKGASIGWQWGVESVDLIMLFINKNSIESLADGQLVLGTNTGVAAGPVGRSAGASTNEKLNAKILTYAHSKGAYIGATLDGISVSINDDANARYYETKGISAQSIFSNKVSYAPPLATQFVLLVDSLTSAGKNTAK